MTLQLWQLNIAEIECAATDVAREVVTQTDHEALLAKEAGQYVPVGKLAVELAEWERDWSDDELEQLGYWKENLVVKAGAWKRLCAEAVHRLMEAALAGELETRGAGVKLAIRRDSFEAWLGRPPKAHPEWAAGYEVVPDDRAAQAMANRMSLKHLRDAIERSPLERMADGPSLAQAIEGVREGLMVGISVRWLDVGELEVVMGEVAEEFGGEDPLKPYFRETLENSPSKRWRGFTPRSRRSVASWCCPSRPKKRSTSSGRWCGAAVRPRSLQNLTPILVPLWLHST